jgi:hypothetical protein
MRNPSAKDETKKCEVGRHGEARRVGRRGVLIQNRRAFAGACFPAFDTTTQIFSSNTRVDMDTFAAVAKGKEQFTFNGAQGAQCPFAARVGFQPLSGLPQYYRFSGV